DACLALRELQLVRMGGRCRRCRRRLRLSAGHRTHDRIGWWRRGGLVHAAQYDDLPAREHRVEDRAPPRRCDRRLRRVAVAFGSEPLTAPLGPGLRAVIYGDDSGIAASMTHL